MDRFKAMQVFTRVVEAGSFTRAAETLEMPRATVTTAIQQLEAHLGVRLLNRTTRRVAVTVDGGAYYERCLHLLEALADTEAMLTQGQRPSGRLRVNLPGRPARLLIIPALPAFCDRYPELDLEIGVSDRPVDLIQEGLDCALRVGPLEVLPDYRPAPSLMSVVYPHNRHLSGKVKVFVDWLVELLRDQPGITP